VYLAPTVKRAVSRPALFHVKHPIAKESPLSEPTQKPTTPPLCDYEGSSYRTDFWEGRGREYEDLAERIALRRLLPPQGERLVDIGGGFGRLVDLYSSYAEVVLMDPSRSLLAEAQQRIQRPGMTYVTANIYSMPFPVAAFDTVVMVRVLHHLSDVPQAFQAIQQVLRPGGSFVLEYANKRHLKAIARYFLGRQTENPFSTKPWEFQPLHFDFHPAYVTQQLRQAKLTLQRTLPVSYFRAPFLKRLIAPGRLAAMDGWLQPLTGWLPLTPSVFTLSTKSGGATSLSDPLFRCPRCHGAKLVPESDILVCLDCSARWDKSGDIYDFRQPLDSAR